MDPEYWNRLSMSASWNDWQRHPAIAAGVGFVTASIAFVVGYALPPEVSAGIWSRIRTGFVALLIYAVIVGFLFLIWTAVVAPIRQRDSARQRIDTLDVELAERDKIEFKLTASYEDSGTELDGHLPRKFRHVNTLWVEVANEGRVATFSARIPPNPMPVSRLEDDFRPESIQVYNVAWEQTLDWQHVLGVGRLRLAAVTTDPEAVFWFWTAENATWNPGSHGVGWRLRPLAGVIEFPLIVTNLTDRKSTTRTCRITFGKDGFVLFDFVGYQD